MSDLNEKPPRKVGAVGAATEATVDRRAAPVNALTRDGSHNNASRQHAAAPIDKLPSFPTMLRKMWNGTEVQRWIDDNIKPLMQERHFEFHCAPDATPVAAISCDVEQMLRDCVPGGYSVDPQKIADDIRAWFEERAAPLAVPACEHIATWADGKCADCGAKVVSDDELAQRALADRDIEMYGRAFFVDGKRVEPERVSIVSMTSGGAAQAVAAPADAVEALAQMRIKSDAGSVEVSFQPKAAALDLKPGEYLLRAVSSQSTQGGKGGDRADQA